MDSANILATLAELEESISGIDSAKKQVDDVVKGYGDARKAFDEVAKAMTGVKANVDSVIKAIKEKSDSLNSEAKEISITFKDGCENVIKDTKDSLESAQKVFEQGIGSSISNLDGKIEALGGCVTSLTNLKNEITSSLVKIEALGKQVNEGKTEIISELREKYNGLNESVSGLSRDIETKTDEILRSEKEQSNTLRNILSSLNDVKKEQENSKKQLAGIIKQQNAVKIISIITLVIVVLGIVFLKL